MFNCIESINRVLLIFDYITYIFSRKYREMTVIDFKEVVKPGQSIKSK
jgi:hypothetical protein